MKKANIFNRPVIASLFLLIFSLGEVSADLAVPNVLIDIKNSSTVSENETLIYTISWLVVALVIIISIIVLKKMRAKKDTQ